MILVWYFIFRNLVTPPEPDPSILSWSTSLVIIAVASLSLKCHRIAPSLTEENKKKRKSSVTTSTTASNRMRVGSTFPLLFTVTINIFLTDWIAQAYRSPRMPKACIPWMRISAPYEARGALQQSRRAHGRCLYSPGTPMCKHARERVRWFLDGRMIRRHWVVGGCCSSIYGNPAAALWGCSRGGGNIYFCA